MQHSAKVTVKLTLVVVVVTLTRLQLSQAVPIIISGYVVAFTPVPPSLINMAPLGVVEFVEGIVKKGETALPF